MGVEAPAMYNADYFSMLDMYYYSAAGSIDSLKTLAVTYVADAWKTPLDSLNARDARELTRFMKPYLDGSKDSTKNDYFPSMKRSAAEKNAQHAAMKLNTAAERFAITKVPVDKELLQLAFNWNRKAMQLMPHETKYKITDAQLQYKTGKKTAAQKIIDGLISKARQHKYEKQVQQLQKVRGEMK